jgi:hypothetical protein
MEAPPSPLWATALFASGLLLRLAAGGSILYRALRMHGLPERLIGLFVVFVAAGELGIVTSTRIRGSVPLATVQLLSAVSLLFLLVGQISLVSALRRVFHPDSAAARVSAWALVAALLAAAAARVATAGDSVVVTAPGFASLSLLGVSLAIDLWWTSESLVFGSRLRKRAALGLADPRLVVRFDLWAVAALAHACGYVGLLACAIVWRRPAAEVPAVLAAIGVASLLSGIAVYGSFNTPRFLIRRIAAGGARTAG